MTTLGERIDGTEYVALRELGRGAMGVTYLARHVTLDRLVAVKLVHPDVALAMSVRRRFIREARALARIRHPNVVELYEFRELPDGQHALVLEYVQGETLFTLLRGGPLPPLPCLRLLAQSLEGLDAAHRAGVIHRDLKPNNLMLRQDGIVKIIDFGLAKGEGLDLKQWSTTDGVFLGTARYASPEQAQSLPLSPASDLYSMGAILYECITGVPMFHGINTNSILLAHIHKEPPPLVDCEALPEVERLQRIVWRAVAKRPDARFPSARAFAQALLEYAEAVSRRHETPAGTRTLLTGEAHNPKPNRLSDPPSVEMPAVRVRRRWSWTHAVLATGIVGGTCGAIVAMQGWPVATATRETETSSARPIAASSPRPSSEDTPLPAPRSSPAAGTTADASTSSNVQGALETAGARCGSTATSSQVQVQTQVPAQSRHQAPLPPPSCGSAREPTSLGLGFLP